MSTEKKTLMEELQEIIGKSDYSQKQLANIAGISEGSMSKYLNEHTEMPVFVFAKIIDALGISADELLFNNEVKAKGKKTAGVNDVLDALQVLLETLDNAIELVPYKAKQTLFEPSKAVDTVVESNGYEYFSSAFVDYDTECYSININSNVIQDLLSSWLTYKELKLERPHQSELFLERIFEEDIKKAKGRYNAIDFFTGGFYNTHEPVLFIKENDDSIPCEFTNNTLSLAPEVFRERFAVPEDAIDDNGFVIGGAEYAIPNENRMLIQKCGYSLHSLDKALDAEDLSKLEPLTDKDIEEMVKRNNRN